MNEPDKINQIIEDLKIYDRFEFVRHKSPEQFCKIGHLYDVTKDHPINNLPVAIDDTADQHTVQFEQRVTVRSSYPYKDDPCQAVIHFIFEDCKETLNNLDQITPKTIKETEYAHFIVEQLKGCQADILLKVNEGQEDELKEIVKLICDNDIPADFNIPEDMTYSVSGRIRLEDKVEEDVLESDELKCLMKFHDLKFYDSIEERFTLSVSVVPFQLELYFGPIFEKLAQMREQIGSTNSGICESIVDFVIDVIVEEIKKTAELIKCGEDYGSSNKFLQTVFASFLLDAGAIKQFVEDLEKRMESERERFHFSEALGTKSSENLSTKMIVQCKIRISVKQCLDGLKGSLIEIFHNKKRIMKNELKKQFIQNLSTETAKVKSDLTETQEKFKLLEDINKGKDFAIESFVEIECESTSNFELKLWNDGQLLDPQPAIFEQPQNIDVKHISPNSISVSWTMNSLPQSSPVSYRVKYSEISSESGHNWKSIPTSGNEQMTTLEDLTPGQYLLKVQAMFDHMDGLFSELIQPIEIKNKKEEKEKRIIDLKDCATEDEIFLLQKALDIQNESNKSIIQRVPSDNCEVGFLFDIEEKRQINKSLKLSDKDVSISSIQSKYRTEYEIINPDHQIVSFIYEDSRQIINSSTTISGKTIKETPYAHFICEQVTGLRANIEFKDEDKDERKFKEVLKQIWGKQKPSEFSISSNIVFSVSGKIPDDWKVERNLEQHNMESLRRFRDLETFEKEKCRLTLNVSVRPFQLDDYFSPIFQKLIHLKEKYFTEADSLSSCLFQFITMEVLQMIKNTSELIKTGGTYLSKTSFLQKLLRSFLLDETELDNFFTDMDNLVQEEQNIFTKTSSENHSDKESFKIQCQIQLSLKSGLNSVKETILKSFNDENSKFRKKALLEIFSAELTEEIKRASSEYNSVDMKLSGYCEENKDLKLVRVNVVSSTCRADKSTIQTRLMKGNILASDKLAFLEAPSNIQPKRTISNGFLLEWDFPEANQSTVVKFRIHGKTVSHKGKRPPNHFKDLCTRTKATMITVEKLTSGMWMFRAQAVFQTIPGLWSGWYGPFPTKDIEQKLSVDLPVLKKLLDSAEAEQIMKSFKESSELEIKLKTSVQCGIGSFFNITEEKSSNESSTILLYTDETPTKLQTLQSLEVERETSTSDNIQCSLISFNYEQDKESLCNVGCIRQLTIAESEVAHFVIGRVQGNRAAVQLRTTESKTAELERISRIISGDIDSDDLPKLSHIKCEVTGQIPEQMKKSEQNLSRELLNELKQLQDKSFYESLSEPFFTKVLVMPFKLDHYFSPIILKLVELKDFVTKNQSLGFFQSVIDLIIKKSMEKIIEAVQIIQSGGDYLHVNQFLKSLNESFLLNTDSLINYFSSLRKKLKEHQSSLDDPRILRKNCLVVKCKFTLSMKKSVETVDTDIAQLFEYNDENICEETLHNRFNDILKEEMKEASTIFESQKRKLDSWKSCVTDKKVEIGYMMVTSHTVEESQLKIEVFEGNKPLSPQPPILEAPYDLKSLNTTLDSIFVTWSLPDCAVSSVTSYDVKYKFLDETETSKPKETDNSDWPSIKTDESSAMIPHLDEGRYVFRVRAVYDNIPGVFSEISEPISTSNSSTGNDTQSAFKSFGREDFKKHLQEKLDESTIRNRITTCQHVLDILPNCSAGQPFTWECDLGQLCDPFNKSTDQRTVSLISTDFITQMHSMDPTLKVSEGVENGEAYKEIYWEKIYEVIQLKPHATPRPTLNTSEKANVVFRMYFGNRIKLRLQTQEKHKSHLEEVFEKNCSNNRNQGKIGDSNIDFWRNWFESLMNELASYLSKESIKFFYSLTGNCLPKDFPRERFRRKTIDNLKTFDYFNLLSSTTKYSPLFIEITSTDMRHYFSPLTEKLNTLMKKATQVQDMDLKDMIFFIALKTSQKIQNTAIGIGECKNYNPAIKFLQDLQNERVLDVENIKDLLEKLNTFCLSCVAMIDNFKTKIPHSSEVMSSQILIQVEFSLPEFLPKSLKALLAQHFENDQSLANYKSVFDELQKLFDKKKKFLNENLEKLLSLIELNSDAKKSVRFELMCSKESQSPIQTTVFKNGMPLDQKFGLLDAPRNVKESQTTRSSITIGWSPSKQGDNFVRSYRVNYRKVDENGEPEGSGDWSSVSTNENEMFQTVTQLEQGSYVFKVQAIYDDLVGVFSEESPPIHTRICFAEKIVKDLKTVEDSTPAVYALPLEEKILDNDSKRRMCSHVNDMGKFHPEKTIILLGATGSGKSTFINGLVNFLFNIDWTDEFRFKIVDVKESGQSKSQAKSQTEWITNYRIEHVPGSRTNFTMNIIDTPGFGDTSGLQRDLKIFDQIKLLFEKDIPVLHAVCIVIPASCMRLTQTQKYIFDTILSIFGNDIKSNIFILVTFADNPDPPVINTLRESEIPFSHYFVFNNSALYANNQGANTFAFTRMFWNLGLDSFKTFVERLNQTEEISLQMTQEVLKERERMEVSVQSMQRFVQEGLSKLETMRQHQSKLKENENKIKDNQNFNYTVDEVDIKLINLAAGQHVTNCLQCNRTCHFPCGIPNNADKSRCSAMNRNGYCNSCPGKCKWDQHVNNPQRIEIQTKKVTKEYSEMKKEFGVAQDGMKGLEDLLKRIETEYQNIQGSVVTTIDEIRETINRLQEIALLPNPINLIEYIDVLINSEKHEQKPGYVGRIDEYQKIKDRTLMVKDIASNVDYAQKVLPGASV